MKFALVAYVAVGTTNAMINEAQYEVLELAPCCDAVIYASGSKEELEEIIASWEPQPVPPLVSHVVKLLFKTKEGLFLCDPFLVRMGKGD